MFDVGFWELVILFGLGLMILGPERLPKVAAKMGRWAGQARRIANNLTSQIRDEIEPFESSMKSMDQNLRKDFSSMRPDIGETGSTANSSTEHADNSTSAAASSSAATDQAATATPEQDSTATTDKNA